MASTTTTPSSWKQEYSLHLPDIDAQHKQLVGLIDELNAAMAQGKGRDKIGQVLTGLLDYTRKHFEYEERLMQTCGYPEVQEHRQIHQRFVGDVKDYLDQFNGGAPALSTLVLHFLLDWLTGHIQGRDREYATHMLGAR